MATYKIDIQSRHGKLHAAFWEATGKKKDVLDSPAMDNIRDVVKSLEAELDEVNFDGDSDSIIWRQIAYDDWSQLSREISLAKY